MARTNTQSGGIYIIEEMEDHSLGSVIELALDKGAQCCAPFCPGVSTSGLRLTAGSESITPYKNH